MLLTAEKAKADRLSAQNAVGRAELERVREELVTSREAHARAQQLTVSHMLIQAPG